MLAQNFKTAESLGIKDKEFDALVKVLGMLERAEVRHTEYTGLDREQIPPGDNFCMSVTHHHKEGCGTVACIGGWAALMMGHPDPNGYVHQSMRQSGNHRLWELYWSQTDRDVTASQAATALRSFLTNGECRWDEALAA